MIILFASSDDLPYSKTCGPADAVAMAFEVMKNKFSWSRSTDKYIGLYMRARKKVIK